MTHSIGGFARKPTPLWTVNGLDSVTGVDRKRAHKVQAVPHCFDTRRLPTFLHSQCGGARSNGFGKLGVVLAISYDENLIVGAGVFGLSSAYHCLLHGEDDVVVIDTSAVLPARI